MSINRGMDKEDWNIYAMEYNTVIKKNEIMPLIATCMDLEIVILSEVKKRKCFKPEVGHLPETMELLFRFLKSTNVPEL